MRCGPNAQATPWPRLRSPVHDGRRAHHDDLLQAWRRHRCVLRSVLHAHHESKLQALLLLLLQVQVQYAHHATRPEPARALLPVQHGLPAHGCRLRLAPVQQRAMISASVACCFPQR